MPTSRFCTLLGIPERTYRRWQTRVRSGRQPRGPWPKPARDTHRAAVTRIAPVPLRARAGQAVDFNVTSPSGRWRARAEPLAGTPDVAVVVSPLNDVEATLR